MSSITSRRKGSGGGDRNQANTCDRVGPDILAAVFGNDAPDHSDDFAAIYRFCFFLFGIQTGSARANKFTGPTGPQLRSS
jgi:hypothetical protein